MSLLMSLVVPFLTSLLTLLLSSIFLLSSEQPQVSIINTKLITLLDLLIIINNEGVEVLIGPTPTGRREGERGDTRILLTAVVKESGQYEGYAFACRPSSPPVNASFLRPQDIYGNYTGHPNITGTFIITIIINC